MEDNNKDNLIERQIIDGIIVEKTLENGKEVTRFIPQTMEPQNKKTFIHKVKDFVDKHNLRIVAGTRDLNDSKDDISVKPKKAYFLGIKLDF